MPPRKYTKTQPTEEDKAKGKKASALPTDNKDYSKVKYEDLEKGDYIMYEMKARSYNGKEYPAKINQGFVSMIQNEVGNALWKDQEGKVLGMTNYGKTWTNNTKDIGDIYRQSKEAALEKKKKGLATVKENEPKRAEKRKIVAEAEASMQKKEKEAAKELENDPEALGKLAKEIQKELKKKPRFTLPKAK